jgi:hypothetical protein
VLFRPFDFAKWMTLGFCAWLANLGREGMSFNVRMPLGVGPAPARPANAPPDSGLPQFVRGTAHWAAGNVELLIALVAAVAIAGVLLGLLITWAKARGTFMFLDGVVHDRGDVARPWTEYKREGNSLFGFMFAFGVATSLSLLLIVAVAAAVAWPDIRAGRFRDDAASGLVLLIPLSLLVLFVSAVVQVLLVDFVVPIMYLRRKRVTAAWGEFGSAILAGHLGTIVCYLLVRCVIMACAGVVAVLVTCATCCVAALPYVGTVILLPLFVFDRAFPLYVLEQYGPGWRIFPTAGKPQGLILDDLPPNGA